MNSLSYRHALAFFLFAQLTVSVSAQSPAPLYDYPENRNFNYGIKPNPSSGIDDAWVFSAFNTWKQVPSNPGVKGFYSFCGNQGGGYHSAFVWFDQDGLTGGDPNNQSVSEGMGYGMLMTAFTARNVDFDSKRRFDMLWQFYKNNRNGNGVMDWKQRGCGGVNLGNNGATDAELDVAMALIIADCQWPNMTGSDPGSVSPSDGSALGDDPHNYRADAQALLNAIRIHETANCGATKVLKPGDQFGGCNCTNASYFAPGYYRAFAQFDPANAAFWTDLANDTYTTLELLDNNTTGLVPDWGRGDNGNPGDGGCPDNYVFGGQRYHYDAARTPWRIALDYLWWGTPEAKAYCERLVNWVETLPGNIAHIRDGYFTNGTRYGTNVNSTFVGPFVLAAMCMDDVGAQARLDNWATYWSAIPIGTSDADADYRYFQRSLRILYGLLATGNFWYPCATCAEPNLGLYASLCGTGGTVTLDSQLPAAGGTQSYTWERNGTPLGGANQNTYVVTLPGTYRVISNNDGCITSDQIDVVGTLNADLGSDVTLCRPSSVTLNPGVYGNGFTYAWEWDGNPTTITDSVLTPVREPGVYEVTVTSPNCGSSVDAVTVSSEGIRIDEGCSPTGPADVTIQAIGGSNFHWFAADGITPVGSGPSITPNVSSTTAYFVYDSTSRTANIGRAANTITTPDFSGPYNVTTADNAMVFDAYEDFTIDSMTVNLICYCNKPYDVRFEVTEPNNVKLAPRALSARTAGVCPAMNCGPFDPFLYTIRVPVGIDVQGGDPKTYWLIYEDDDADGDMSLHIERRSSNNSGTPFPWPYLDNTIVPGAAMRLTGVYAFTGTPSDVYPMFYDIDISYNSYCEPTQANAYIGGCPPQVLPVELVSFKATPLNGQVNLEWVTALEENSAYFVVERSSNGNDFSALDQVGAAGTTSQTSYYSILDPEPFAGQNYYRLRQVDNDGAAHLSQVVVATIGTVVGHDLSLYPNPTNGVLYAQLGGQEGQMAKAQIFDMLGSPISGSMLVPAGQEIALASGLPAGLYVVRVTFADGVTVSQRVMSAR